MVIREVRAVFREVRAERALGEKPLGDAVTGERFRRAGALRSLTPPGREGPGPRLVFFNALNVLPFLVGNVLVEAALVLVLSLGGPAIMLPCDLPLIGLLLSDRASLGCSIWD